MLEDFYTRAIVAGMLVALLAAPFGCFVIWRRMAYFGDTMAHSALLGITLALLTELPIGMWVFAVALATAAAMIYFQRRSQLPSDTLLGILSHSTLAIGLLSLGFLTGNSVDIMSYLVGDVLTVSVRDIQLIAATTAIALVLLVLIWKPLLATTVNADLAVAEGKNANAVELIYLLLLAAVIAITVRIVGVLLITALLVIPAATARRLAGSPEQMAVIAAVLGALAVLCGLGASLWWDTAAGPSIVVAALIIFLGSTLLRVRN